MPASHRLAAAQPWCNGKVGMMGISWGGFNCLQVAAKQPPALKAIITLCSTDRPLCRRHPLQGRLPAQREFRLGLDHAVLFVAAAGPGARRRQMARHVADRLENEPFLPAVWLKHQRRDAYWKRGSVCEDFSADQGRDAADRRLGRRLQERGLAPGRGHRGAGQGHRRPMDPQISAFRRAQAARSASCRRRCAGGTAG